MNTVINAKELRQRLPEVVEQVGRGVRFTVLYRSRPAFDIVPAETATLVREPADAAAAYAAAPRSGTGVADKLRAMEDLWSELQRTPEDVPSPAWHGDVLRAREARVRAGTARFADWADAKRRLRAHPR